MNFMLFKIFIPFKDFFSEKDFWCFSISRPQNYTRKGNKNYAIKYTTSGEDHSIASWAADKHPLPPKIPCMTRVVKTVGES